MEGSPIKAFTTFEPFAMAIARGIKPHETRSRWTSIRGRVAIHAGKKSFEFGNDTERKIISDALGFSPRKYLLGSRTCEELERYMAGINELPHGAVIGTVEIVDCIPTEEVSSGLTELEMLLGDYSRGRYAWVLRDPVLFEKPIPARGNLGWWEWNGPPEAGEEQQNNGANC